MEAGDENILILLHMPSDQISGTMPLEHPFSYSHQPECTNQKLSVTYLHSNYQEILASM